MEDRPKLIVRPTLFDHFIEWLGYALLAATFIWAGSMYFTLPDTIPVHFNIKGEADAYGGKLHILALPFVSAVLLVGMTMLNRYPWVFNYPVKISSDNAPRHYTAAVRLIRWLKLSIVTVFFLIVLGMTTSASEGKFAMGTWLLPAILLIVNLPLVIYLISVFSKPNRTKQ